MQNVYKVFQLQLNDKQVAEVNEKGWDGVPYSKAYLDCTFFFDVIDMELICTAAEHDLFVHTCNITADDLNHAYAIGNGALRGKVKTHCPHKSISVGDILIDQNGNAAVVATFGFIEMTEEQKKEFETLVKQVADFE